MTEALNRGCENRDSRSPTLLQRERCGLKVEVHARRIQEVLERDPPHDGADELKSIYHTPISTLVDNEVEVEIEFEIV